MNKNYSYLAIIPARGGSKQIPDKNITLVGGKPLIEWTIQAAKNSGYINRIIVSTDSHSIADISRELGAEVPFIRPDEISKDDTPGMQPIIHTIRWVAKNEGYQPDIAICLQPTSPLRTAEDIDGAIILALKKDADAVVSVSRVKQHPYWFKKLDGSGRISDFIELETPINCRQELPSLYSLNGAIYLAKRQFLLDRGTWYSENTYGYIMPTERSIDIDVTFDLSVADMILKGDFEL